MKKFSVLSTVGAAMLSLSAAAHGAPFVNVALIARPAGSSDAYSSVIRAEAGDAFDYQVRISMAPLGTTNTQGATVRTISSLNNNPASPTQGDGVNSMSFNIIDPTTDGTGISFPQVGALATTNAAADWTGGNSDTPGTLNANGDIVGVRPIHSAGVFTGVNGDLVYSGTFTVDTFTDAGTLTLGWGGTLSGLKVNTGTAIVANNGTETGADPFFGYSPLQVTAVPEPTSLALVGLATAGLLARRRRA